MRCHSVKIRSLGSVRGNARFVIIPASASVFTCSLQPDKHDSTRQSKAPSREHKSGRLVALLGLSCLPEMSAGISLI